MKIRLLQYGEIICYEEKCPFIDHCSNHISVDRDWDTTDKYFSPELVLINEKIECKTMDRNVLYDGDFVYPANIDSLGYGEVYLEKNNEFKRFLPENIE